MMLRRREADSPAIREAMREAQRDHVWHCPARLGFLWWLAMFGVCSGPWLFAVAYRGSPVLAEWAVDLPRAALLATVWLFSFRFLFQWLVVRSVRHAPRRLTGLESAVEIRSQSGKPLKRIAGESLAGTDLAQVCLQDASLYKADLRGATLRGADLRGACLVRAELEGADLSDARLACAYLNGANLRSADLRGADLRGSMLIGTELAAARYDATTRWPAGFDPARRVRQGIGREVAPSGSPDGRGDEVSESDREVPAVPRACDNRRPAGV